MSNLAGRHDATQRARALFVHDHLPPELAELSRQCAELADWMIEVLPDDAMLREGLIKLWEAKNCFVYVAARIGTNQSPNSVLAPRGYSPDPAHARDL